LGVFACGFRDDKSSSDLCPRHGTTTPAVYDGSPDEWNKKDTPEPALFKWRAEFHFSATPGSWERHLQHVEI